MADGSLLEVRLTLVGPPAYHALYISYLNLTPDLVIVFPVPFLQKSRVVAHRLQHRDELLQLLRHNLRGNWSEVPVNILF